MSDSVDVKKGSAVAGAALGGGTDVASLLSSLRLEREKNEVLLEEHRAGRAFVGVLLRHFPPCFALCRRVPLKLWKRKTVNHLLSD